MSGQQPLFPEDAPFTPGNPEDIIAFREMIRSFYAQHRRPMPWRDDISPYRVVVSELMLQQTQVPRVMEKFPAFVARFPGFGPLASAPFGDVLRAWQGLGYNRRARYLQQIAMIVIEQYSGVLPRDPVELVKLPGIGPATAGSIAAFAFNHESVFIETNIRRVFIHHFFPAGTTVHDDDLLPLVSAALDWRNPREWYYALMDYGTWLATTVANPNRRSSHYSRQAPFQGSDREIRGKILKILLETDSLPAGEISHYLGSDPDRIMRILDDLIREGLVERVEKNQVRINDNSKRIAENSGK